MAVVAEGFDALDRVLGDAKITSNCRALASRFSPDVLTWTAELVEGLAADSK